MEKPYLLTGFQRGRRIQNVTAEVNYGILPINGYEYGHTTLLYYPGISGFENLVFILILS